MAKKIDDTVEVELTAHLRLEDQDFRPGARVMVPLAEARDMVAIGFAKATPASYRALRASAH